MSFDYQSSIFKGKSDVARLADMLEEKWEDTRSETLREFHETYDLYHSFFEDDGFLPHKKKRFERVFHINLSLYYDDKGRLFDGSLFPFETLKPTHCMQKYASCGFSKETVNDDVVRRFKPATMEIAAHIEKVMVACTAKTLASVNLMNAVNRR